MDPKAVAKLNQQVQQEVKKLQEVAKEIAQMVGPRTKLQTAINENKLVQQELELMEDEAVVYQMVGPVLIKRDLDEVKDNVKARLKLVEGQMQGLDKQEKDLESKKEEIRNKILSMQKKFKEGQQRAVQQQLAQQERAAQALQQPQDARDH
eukprot:g10940.t1